MPTQNAPCCQLRGFGGFFGVLGDAMGGAHAVELPVGHAGGELEHVLARRDFRAQDATDIVNASAHSAPRQDSFFIQLY
jgi:hypothetical protein